MAYWRRSSSAMRSKTSYISSADPGWKNLPPVTAEMSLRVFSPLRVGSSLPFSATQIAQLVKGVVGVVVLPVRDEQECPPPVRAPQHLVHPHIAGVVEGRLAAGHDTVEHAGDRRVVARPGELEGGPPVLQCDEV